MAGNKSLRRAVETSEVVRINSDIPNITDTTELVNPQLAEELLTRNKGNRPVNWRKVEEYAVLMREGKWRLHAQGIVLDGNGNILTGQTRLWAVVTANASVYMRISRGNPPDVATLLDRGRPQSARDLATRKTDKRHSPIEASIARAMLALRGVTRPSTDELSDAIATNKPRADVVLRQTSGTKKTKGVLMALAAICECSADSSEATRLSVLVEKIGDKAAVRLLPQTPETCWNRGAAFSLAMETVRLLVEEQRFSPKGEKS